MKIFNRFRSRTKLRRLRNITYKQNKFVREVAERVLLRSNQHEKSLTTKITKLNGINVNEVTKITAMSYWWPSHNEISIAEPYQHDAARPRL
jgi:hypothetical protein